VVPQFVRVLDVQAQLIVEHKYAKKQTGREACGVSALPPQHCQAPTLPEATSQARPEYPLNVATCEGATRQVLSKTRCSAAAGSQLAATNVI
jgi:hypothetical protein